MNRLTILRKQKELTMSELAEKAGVSRQYIWQFENDRITNPSAKILDKLAQALEVDIRELLKVTD